MKQLLLFYFVLLSTASLSLGQSTEEKVISGEVYDESASPIPGANITLKRDVLIGTISDFDGHFSILARPTDTLVFSSIGLKTKEVVIGSSTHLKVELEPDVKQLSEVVIVGYGTQDKKDVTGSITTMSGDDLTSTGNGSIMQSLTGKVAGVVINNADNAPGAGLSITMRGGNSINASSAPLYVIDGFPIEVDQSSGSNLESSAMNPLSGIDPNDIETITFLKDASATAIYGARGANGVVIITTKKGSEENTSVSVSMMHGISQPIRKYDPMNSLEYATLRRDQYYPFYKRMEEAPAEDDPNLKYYNVQDFADTTSTDWIDQIMQQGKTQNYNVSVSGGSKKSSYLASVSYYNNQGVIKNTNFDRYTGNFSINSNPKKWLKFAFNTRFSYSENDGTVTVNSNGAITFSGIMTQAIRKQPTHLPEQNFISDDDLSSGANNGNPLIILNDVKINRIMKQNTTNGQVTINPLKGLVIKSKLGFNFLGNDLNYFAPEHTPYGLNYGGIARIKKNTNLSWLNENTVTYSKIVSGHSFSLLGGYSIQSTAREWTTMESTGFSVNNLGTNNIGIGDVHSVPFSAADDYYLLSYLGRFNYKYKNRYLLTASFRADGSSKFSENNKWGYFPSLALGWRIDQENFLKKSNLFEVLKLRAGWGETGNPNIQPYQSIRRLEYTKYPLGDKLATAAFARLGNPNLQWETTVQTNFGLDVSLKKLPIDLTVDVYQKNTRDLLLNGEVSPSSGYRSFLYNSGSVQNRGLEISLNLTPINKKFRWDMNFNIAFNRNEVTNLGDLTSRDWIDVPKTKNYNTAILQEGMPIGLWYGYEVEGIWQQTDFTWDPTKLNGKGEYVINDGVKGALPGTQPGDWKFKDINNDGEITAEDKTVVGISQPLHTGGLTNTFSYKGIDLSVFLEWSYGREVYNANQRFGVERAASGSNSLDVDYWRPIQYGLDENGYEDRSVVLDPGNIDAKYPGASNANPQMDMHSGYIEDGSYLRVRNITLGYTLSERVLDKIKLDHVRIYANVLNAFTFTNYSGYDPNINSQSLGGLRPGYDFNSYPLSRTYMLGLNVKF